MSRQRRPSGETQRAEDFVYHLYRGSTLLLRDEVSGAKQELERALALQPADAKSQDLLASTYFRLGLYPRAIDLWSTLVEQYPESATLRVNLALALFKTGQNQLAQAQLTHALRIKPDHKRAWGYLGLIYWRASKYVKAREAFERAHQPAMIRRMDIAIAESGAAVRPNAVPMTLPPDEGQDVLAAQDRAAMRSAAEEALTRLESEHPHLALAHSDRKRAASGEWSSIELGKEFLGSSNHLARSSRISSAQERAEPPASLSNQLSAWSVELPDAADFGISATGDLLVQVRSGDIFSRLTGLRAVRGELRASPASRTSRGEAQEAFLGGREPVMRCRAPISAVIAAKEDHHFFLLQLQRGETLFLREEYLFAFSGTVKVENAKLSFGKSEAQIANLGGPGQVAMQLRAAPNSISVFEGESVYVDPRSLVGWTGRLFPRAQRGTAPYAALAPDLVFRGEGAILLATHADR